MNAFFVAGTDTDVGKTYVSALLLKSAAQAGLSSLGLKPIAAGAELVGDQLQNDDAEQLMSASSIELPYAAVNPVCLAEAMAPHLAAKRAGVELKCDELLEQVRQSLHLAEADLSLVEGAGGWRVPLVPGFDMADLARALDLPVILVVGMRLGCLNHAQLSAEAILKDGLSLAGWIANELDTPMHCLDENIETLAELMPAPMLARVSSGALSLDISKVLKKLKS
ncbi:dethiobiotin synthase [Agaribacterium sp. ZY112]|uniref:dethiobiotin synthase n=1 Tax=Agaribacterium sp. ZY112 TaxID=3233574 RepID=UPI00352330EC